MQIQDGSVCDTRGHRKSRRTQDTKRGFSTDLSDATLLEQTGECCLAQVRCFRGGRCHHPQLNGEHVRVEGGKLLYPPVQKPYPPLYFGGLSGAGQHVAADHCDVHLTWGEPPAGVAEKLGQARQRAADRGRTLSFGIRSHVVVRETAEEARQEADALIQHVDDEAVAFSQSTFACFDSAGQQRMARLHNGRRNRLEISPDLWAGVRLVRGGAGTALVGNPEPVAARMREYMELGIDRFILSGYPHLEECYRFAELVFPLLLQPATTVAPRSMPDRSARSSRTRLRPVG